MQLFLDNDIILKLTAIGKLLELKEIFDVDDKSIFILPSAIHYFRKNKRLKINYPQEVIERAIQIISNFSQIPDADESRLKKFDGIDGIDSGEQILFSVNPVSDEFYILTGDKKALKALNSSGLEDVKNDLAGKIICLELILSKFLDLEGLDTLLPIIEQGHYCCDSAVKMIFSQQNINEENIKYGLNSNIRELRGTIDLISEVCNFSSS